LFFARLVSAEFTAPVPFVQPLIHPPIFRPRNHPTFLLDKRIPPGMAREMKQNNTYSVSQNKTTSLLENPSPHEAKAVEKRENLAELEEFEKRVEEATRDSGIV
jgi:hypothetical protein